MQFCREVIFSLTLLHLYPMKIPDRPFLGCPALMDLETIFKTKLINGEKHRLRHYKVSDINLVTTSLTGFLENLRNKASRTMYVCHVTRDDLILGFMVSDLKI